MPDYILGLDLGLAADYSALCILEQSEQPATDPEERPQRHYGCRGLKRWPAGTSYPQILAFVVKLVESTPLRQGTLVLGATLVGRPVVDLFRQAKLAVQIQPVIITAGQAETWLPDGHQVGKVVLISGVQVLLQQRRLRFAQALPETATLLKELQNYRLKAPPAPGELFDPRDRQHDDLVLALTLACWWGERRRREILVW